MRRRTAVSSANRCPKGIRPLESGCEADQRLPAGRVEGHGLVVVGDEPATVDATAAESRADPHVDLATDSQRAAYVVQERAEADVTIGGHLQLADLADHVQGGP